MKKLVIFDLDGTLLDTIKDLGTASNYALAKHGYPEHKLEIYSSLVGNGVKKLIERALPAEAVSDEIIEMLLADFKEYYDGHCTDITTPYKGMPEVVKSLRKMGIEVAVASNKYQKAVDRIVAHYFGDVQFVAVEGQKENVPTKPDPSIVFSILLKADIRKEDVLYVGDSGIDMETACRACVDCVGVTWGFRTERELRAKCATFIVHKPTQILDIVQGEKLLEYYNKSIM